MSLSRFRILLSLQNRIGSLVVSEFLFSTETEFVKFLPLLIFVSVHDTKRYNVYIIKYKFPDRPRGFYETRSSESRRSVEET